MRNEITHPQFTIYDWLYSYTCNCDDIHAAENKSGLF